MRIRGRNAQGQYGPWGCWYVFTTPARQSTIQGVARIRNGTGTNARFLDVINGYDRQNQGFFARTGQVNREAISQNMRLTWNSAQEFYTIAPLSSANGFSRLLTASGSNLILTSTPATGNPTQNQQFRIDPIAGTAYSHIRLRHTPSLALERVGDTVQLRQFNSTNVNQRWAIERNHTYNEQENHYARLGWHWPVNNNAITNNSLRFRITSSFGFRQFGTRPRHMHSGLDIGNGGATSMVNGHMRGPELLAVAAGRVTGRGFSQSAGEWIEITITNQFTFNNRSQEIRVRYAHLHPQDILPTGTPVTAGQRIGFMGTTGDSDAVHLHLDVFTTGDALAYGNLTNPLQFFRGFRNQINLNN